VSLISYFTADGRILQKKFAGWVDIAKDYEYKRFIDITEYSEMYALDGK
jgi:hypothetical protein